VGLLDDMQLRVYIPIGGFLCNFSFTCKPIIPMCWLTISLVFDMIHRRLELLPQCKHQEAGMTCITISEGTPQVNSKLDKTHKPVYAQVQSMFLVVFISTT
jgi:hypothetical protein